VDRRSSALIALILFAIFTIVAIVVSGTRPALEQGIAPSVIQGVGYVFGLAGAVLVLLPDPAAPSGQSGRNRTSGIVLLVAMAVLVATEVVAANDGEGANIGLGGVRLICLVVIAVVIARLAAGSAALRRHSRS
jgi:hypothetical protein